MGCVEDGGGGGGTESRRWQDAPLWDEAMRKEEVAAARRWARRSAMEGEMGGVRVWLVGLRVGVGVTLLFFFFSLDLFLFNIFINYLKFIIFIIN